MNAAEKQAEILKKNGYHYAPVQSTEYWFLGVSVVACDISYTKATAQAYAHYEAQQEALAQAANDAAGEAAYNEVVEELRQQLADAQARIDAAVAIVEKGLLNPLSIEDVILLEGILKPERHAHMEYTAPVADAPKFKVGDKVRVSTVRYPEGMFDTIEYIAENGKYSLRTWHDDENERRVHYLSIWREDELEAYTDAPQPLAEVTLREDEIAWLALHWQGACRAFVVKSWVNPAFPLIVQRDKDVTWLRGEIAYQLAETFDTPANRAAIEARRKQLGL